MTLPAAVRVVSAAQAPATTSYATVWPASIIDGRAPNASRAAAPPPGVAKSLATMHNAKHWQKQRDGHGSCSFYY